MNEFTVKKDELIGYIQRSIIDIARKCNVYDDIVIKEIKELCNK